MLIESDPHQVRIAILEDDRLTETFVERRGHQGTVGNVYKGRVSRVLPGMQAAFIDIGLERDAFLYVSDVVPGDLSALSETGRLLRSREGPPAPNGDDTENEDCGPLVVDIQPEPAIEDLLQRGQEILVQVTKDALSNKGARVSANITLPSRYLVLLPTVAHLGVSRRIEREEERERLREVLGQLDSGSDGIIVRTAGEGLGAADLNPDLVYLRRAWSRIHATSSKVGAPTLVHRDLDLALRIVRDFFNQDYDVLWVDSAEIYERVVEFLGQVQPALASRVKLDQRESALFDRFRVEQEIEAALKSKVWLKSGGYLVINQTEALVAIDVNTGRYVGQHSLEDTVKRTNLEAVREIVRQIRLRDLSGIIIIDLIDMNEQEHRDQVFTALTAELEKDRAKTKLLNISEFGLVELTRKRSHANLERILTRRCPYCQGSGRIKTTTSICLNIRREVLTLIREGGVGRDFLLRVHPDVASALQGSERAILDELESVGGLSLLLQSDANLHHERFDLAEV